MDIKPIGQGWRMVKWLRYQEKTSQMMIQVRRDFKVINCDKLGMKYITHYTGQDPKSGAFCLACFDLLGSGD